MSSNTKPQKGGAAIESGVALENSAAPNFNDNLPLIQVKNLSKHYQLQANQGSLREALARPFKHGKAVKDAADDKNSLWALKDVSFEVRRGEALGIVGPNGAGKTTILKLISRVTRPTQGTIQTNGRLGALLELGAGFHPDLTGRENIFLYGSILGMSHQKIGEKFDQIVEFSGLERFIDTPVKRYSSGMYVRLAFSVASHTDPDILLVDEVLAVGDAEFRQKCINRIKLLQQAGIGTIFISHNLFQMRSVCEQGVFLLGGQVQVNGTIDEAILAYEGWLRRGSGSRNGSKPFEFIAGQGGSDLTMLGIEVCSPQGTPKERFQYTDGAEFRLHYAAQRPFASIHFVLRVIRTDGLVCAMVRSSDLGLKVDRLQGQGHLSICLDELQLASGDYLIEARLRDGSDAVTLAKGSSPVFQVQGPNPSRDAESGIFVPHITDVNVNNLDGLEQAPAISKNGRPI